MMDFEVTITESHCQGLISVQYTNTALFLYIMTSSYRAYNIWSLGGVCCYICMLINQSSVWT